MKISKELSNTLLLANFYCTILVVSIHYNSLYHYDRPEPTDIFYLIQTYINISLTRIAVPFFALTSGFFLFLNFQPTFENYTILVKRRLRTLLVPYLTVAIIVFIFNRMLNYSKAIPFDFSGTSILNSIITPETIQLWYIRDLLFLVAASPIIFFLCRKAAHIYISTITTMWVFDYQPFPMFGDWHLITIEALYFFSLGCVISLKTNFFAELFCKTNLENIYKLCVIYLFLTFFRVYFAFSSAGENEGWQYICGTLAHKSSIIIGIILVIIASKSYQLKFLLQLAGLTFFVYLYHLLPLSKFILLFWNNFISEKHLFYVTTPSALIISFALAWFLKSKIAVVYRFLTGGR